jgi:Uma2 family endonuclease
MTPTVATEGETVADLITHFGVPPDRIRMKPFPGTATEQDVILSRRLCELVDATLVEKPMGYYESLVAWTLGYFLQDFLTTHDLGFVFGEAGMVRVEPGQVRMPDVAFVSWDHFPNRRLPPDAILDLVPDFAVEVVSPSNTRVELARKRREYFAGGARLVWQVYPDKRTVEVYTDPDTFTTLGEDDTLTGDPVLPGFTLSVRRWFERAGQRGT